MARRTIVLFTVLAAALLAAPASAQTTRDWGWGVAGGVGISYATVPDGTTRDMEPTFTVGVFGVWPLSDNWSFQPEVKFDKRTINTGEIPTDIDYLSAAAVFRNRIGGIYMVQGISLNTVMRASIFDADFKDALNSPDIALIIGVGKRFERWSLEGRWETGLRELQKELQLDGVRARTLTAVVSWYVK